MTGDRLAFIVRAPDLVEGVVRHALARRLAARRDGHAALDVREFSNAALRELERRLAAGDVPLDAVGRHELAGATLRAAGAFAASPLARRLARVPERRFLRAPAGCDALVADARGGLHAVRLETFAGDDARVALAREIAAALRFGRAGLREPAFHFFSLRDGRFRSFAAPPATVRARGAIATAA